MATASQVEEAALTPRRPVGRGIGGRLAQVKPADPQQQALAARCVRRFAGGHTAELLDMLGLTGLADTPAGSKRCTNCGRTLPVKAFHKRGAGRHSHCKDCRKTTRKDGS
jgi:hypothetical protein